jgi:serine/threonine-protein kinase RsbW
MIKVVIPSITSEAVKVLERIIAEAQRTGYDNHALFAIRLALDESLSNAIRHGSKNDPSKTIMIEFEVNAERVIFTICDEGPGFNSTTLPDPTLEENLEMTSGRGVMLIRAYMTSVDYNDRGNCVTMVKRKDCKLPRVEV